MDEVLLHQLDRDRKEGMKPVAVACILNSKHQLLMVHSEEFGLWGLSQGGILPDETITAALEREIKQSLGEKFLAQLQIETKNPRFLLDIEKVIFPPSVHGAKQIPQSDGSEIPMIGKKYYFALVQAKTDDLSSVESPEYDEAAWVSSKEGYALAATIYQRGKKRIVTKILETLDRKKMLVK